jgi:hypothetical protein
MAVDWLRAFPRDVAPVVTEAAQKLPPAEFEQSGLITESNSRAWPTLLASGQAIEIPYRIYNEQLSARDWDAATSVERTVLGCFYSRHHDGHVRQAVLPWLLDSAEHFVAPFVVQLLGEYVLEIVVDIAERIERDLVNGPCLLEALSQFAHENPAFVTLTEARARSYWAEYYRREFLWARDYPALIAISRISA